jgi:NTP pyrophosphatase (non-canonical NTP hydrolase)
MTINQTTKPQTIDVCNWLNANPGIKAVVGAICEEYVRAVEAWPNFPLEVVHAAAIVGEEAGELLQAANNVRWKDDDIANRENLLEEATQVGAMAVRFLINVGELKGGSDD